ncbi:hypothetical protein PZA11_005102 [Diplocarpon coronariae]|uniref:Uncharacterized protein n=1 Tax=Diplocarpon coronariae TaxID=2795749 RepID=A0A218ZAF2_9HELO|nr:hypothetical protein JHW43_002654 [Diplocarpon mali]OWP04543.1 hypothetical protein B2J93_1402 [Marssonina coronariae]
MPPTRTQQPLSTGPMKLMKTERTHEENQERAYIAASRRSDRSLEARVESARRASEIHKRRTGRSLRVTEKDVMDEEMYEEEDDGLPRQYRQLAAHLQTGNPDFNNRLEAYLTANVAMRSALERTISNSYASQGQVSPFPTQYGAVYPSPMLAHQYQPQPMLQRPMQQSMQAPAQQQQQQNQYRHAPYPSPRLSQPQSSAPLATPAIKAESSDDQVSPVMASDSRRSSIPTTPVSASSASTPTATRKPSFPQGSFALDFQFPPTQNLQFNNSFQTSSTSGNFGPFSTTLPNDAQNLLGSTFPANEASMMGGAESLPSYNYTQPLPETRSIGKQQMYPSLEGLNSTLAPSTSDQTAYQPNDFFNEAMGSGITPGQTPNLDSNDWNSYLNFDDFPSSQNSG